jgi:hypothetical protein
MSFIKSSLLRIGVVVIFPMLGCVSLDQIPVTEFVAPTATDTAYLYVFRANSMPTRRNVNIQIDEEIVAVLPDDHFTWVAVKPGLRKVRIGYVTLHDFSKTVELNFEVNQKHLIRYHGDAGSTSIPVFGYRGLFLGAIQTEPRRGASTHLELLPIDKFSDLVEAYPYFTGRK